MKSSPQSYYFAGFCLLSMGLGLTFSEFFFSPMFIGIFMTIIGILMIERSKKAKGRKHATKRKRK